MLELLFTHQKWIDRIKTNCTKNQPTTTDDDLVGDVTTGTFFWDNFNDCTQQGIFPIQGNQKKYLIHSHFISTFIMMTFVQHPMEDSLDLYLYISQI